MRSSIIALLFVPFLFAIPAGAQPQPATQYAAKFICGKPPTSITSKFIVAPGAYYTTINVHNPAIESTITLRKKFAIALPNEKPGRISEWFGARLKPDEAMQVDCGDIYQHLAMSPGTFVEGFAVFMTDRGLDVIGVYTTAPPGGGVSSIHMERAIEIKVAF